MTRYVVEVGIAIDADNDEIAKLAFLDKARELTLNELTAVKLKLPSRTRAIRPKKAK